MGNPNLKWGGDRNTARTCWLPTSMRRHKTQVQRHTLPQTARAESARDTRHLSGLGVCALSCATTHIHTRTHMHACAHCEKMNLCFRKFTCLDTIIFSVKSYFYLYVFFLNICICTMCMSRAHKDRRVSCPRTGVTDGYSHHEPRSFARIVSVF